MPVGCEDVISVGYALSAILVILIAHCYCAKGIVLLCYEERASNISN